MRLTATLLFAGVFVGFTAAGSVTGHPAWAQPGPVVQSVAAPGSAGDAAARRATERVEQHIADLRRRMGITPAQQPLWDGFANVLRRNAQDMEQSYRNRLARGVLAAPDDLQAYADAARLHADNLARLVEPFTALYAALAPDQRTAADRIFRDFERRPRPQPKF